MARRPGRRASGRAPRRAEPAKDRIVDALMRLLASHSFARIGLAEIAGERAAVGAGHRGQAAVAVVSQGRPTADLREPERVRWCVGKRHRSDQRAVHVDGGTAGLSITVRVVGPREYAIGAVR